MHEVPTYAPAPQKMSKESGEALDRLIAWFMVSINMQSTKPLIEAKPIKRKRGSK